MKPLNQAATSLTIANGQTTSTELAIPKYADRLTFFVPTTTNLLTLQVSPVASGNEWHVQQSGGEDVTIASGKAATVVGVSGARLRFVSAGAEGAARTIKVWYRDDL